MVRDEFTCCWGIGGVGGCFGRRWRIISHVIIRVCHVMVNPALALADIRLDDVIDARLAGAFHRVRLSSSGGTRTGALLLVDRGLHERRTVSGGFGCPTTATLDPRPHRLLRLVVPGCNGFLFRRFLGIEHWFG